MHAPSMTLKQLHKRPSTDTSERNTRTLYSTMKDYRLTKNKDQNYKVAWPAPAVRMQTALLHSVQYCITLDYTRMPAI